MPILGSHHSEKAKQKIREANLGNKHWLGKKHTAETITKMREIKVGSRNPMFGRTESNCPSWKGDDIKYKAIHMWVRAHKPKSDHCEHCGIMGKRLDAAYTRHPEPYTRDVTLYIWLCRQCHNDFDKKNSMSALKDQKSVIYVPIGNNGMPLFKDVDVIDTPQRNLTG